VSEILVYDDALKPISSSYIEIIENDGAGRKVQVQVNSARGGGLYGATMKLPSPLGPVGFWIDDLGGKYAPTGVQYFNPTSSLRLEITLFPVPAAKGSPSPPGGDDPFDDIEEAQVPASMLGQLAGQLPRIRKLTGWSVSEMRGFAMLLVTLTHALTVLDADASFIKRVRRWNRVLLQLLRTIAKSTPSGSSSSTPIVFTPTSLQQTLKDIDETDEGLGHSTTAPRPSPTPIIRY
jgi:hypothetical protein